MVRLNGIHRVAQSHHAEPRPIRLKIWRVRMSHRVRLLIPAQIGNLAESPVVLDPEYPVHGIQQSVRTTRPSRQRIEPVTNKREISNPTQESARRRVGFIRRQVVSNRRPHSLEVKLRDAARISPGVWADRKRHRPAY